MHIYTLCVFIIRAKKFLEIMFSGFKGSSSDKSIQVYTREQTSRFSNPEKNKQIKISCKTAQPSTFIKLCSLT